MATSVEKVLRIKIEGSATNAEEAFRKLSGIIDKSDVSLQGFKSTLNHLSDGLADYAHEIVIVADAQNKLDKVRKQLISTAREDQGAFGKFKSVRTDIDTGAAIEKEEKERKAAIKRYYDSVLKERDDRLSLLRKEYEVRAVAVKHGEDSLLAIEKSNALKRQEILKEANARIQAIQEDFALKKLQGSKATGAKADMQIEAVLRNADKEIAALDKVATKRRTEIAKEQAELTALLNTRKMLEAEEAKIIDSKIKHQQTLADAERKAAIKRYELEEKLSSAQIKKEQEFSDEAAKARVNRDYAIVEAAMREANARKMALAKEFEAEYTKLLEEADDKRKAKIKEYEEAVIANEKSIAKQREYWAEYSAHVAEHDRQATTRMYKEMFDAIEARDREHTEKTLSEARRREEKTLQAAKQPRLVEVGYTPAKPASSATGSPTGSPVIASFDAEAEYTKQLEAKKRLTEQQKTLYAEEASIFRKYNAEHLAEMENNIQLQNAIAQHGANSKQAIAIRLAQKEKEIRSKLSSDLRQIEANVAAGLTTQSDAINQRTKAIDAASKALIGHSKAAKEAEISHKSFASRVIESIALYRVFTTTVNLGERALLNIPKAGIALESTMASLTATFRNTSGAAREMQYLEAEAQRTGITVKTLRESYQQAAASFIMAGESAETTRHIFSNINTVATTLHLSTDKVSGVFLALSQMFNKGKVQAEELTRQLAQTLPGITNITAQALGITAQKLGEAMKKGQVTAHEAVAKMSDEIATAFGGKAFDQATVGLNAATGRLQTAWTLLSENIYKSSSGALIGVINFTTKSIEGLRELTDNVYAMQNAFDSAAKILLGAVGFGAAGSMITKIIAATSAAAAEGTTIVGALTGALAGLTRFLKANWMTALLTALGAVVGKLEAIKNQAHNLEDWIADREKSRKVVDVKGTTQTERITYALEKDDRYKEVKQRYEEAKKRANTRYSEESFGLLKLSEEETRGRIELAKRYGEELEKTKKELIDEITKADNELQSKLLKPGRDLSGIDEKIAEYNSAHTGDKRADAIARAKAHWKKEIDELEGELASKDADRIKAAQQRMDAINAAIANAVDKSMAASNSISSATRAALKTQQDYIDTVLANTKSTIAELDLTFNKNLITTDDYFAEKKRIYEKDIELQRSYLEKQLAIAKASGNKGLIETAQENLKQLEAAQKGVQAKIENEQVNEIRKQEDVLNTFNQKYNDMFGITTDINVVLEDNIRLLRERTELESKADPTKKELLTRIDTYNANLNLQKQITAMNKQDAESQRLYNMQVRELTSLQEENLIGDFSATQLHAQYAQQRMAVLQKEIDLMEEGKKKMTDANLEFSTASQDRIDRMKQELSTLQLAANGFATKFTKTLGDGFDKAFEGLVTGSMNGKQAFSAFATSVVQDIQKMIVQEMRSMLLKVILKPLMSQAGDMLGLSSLTSGSGAFDLFSSSSANLSSAASAGSSWASSLFADGGVATGRNISQYSGTVVDKPTFFASGGNIMGEAGPEAILPLKRNSAGKLGVSLENAGQAQTSNVYYINTSVEVKDTNASADDIASKTAEATMRAIARQEISSANRVGNQLNRTTKV